MFSSCALIGILLLIHNLNTYQIKFIILPGIVLFQSLKFYDDEIPCKQANLLDTDVLVLSVTVVHACELCYGCVIIAVYIIICIYPNK